MGQKLGARIYLPRLQRLRDELGVEGDFGVVELGDGAIFFGGVGAPDEGFLSGAWDFSAQSEVAVSDSETVAFLIKRDGAGGVDAIGFEAFVLEDQRERHGKAAGMSGGEELFGVGAGTLFEAGLKGIRSGGEYAAGG